MPTYKAFKLIEALNNSKGKSSLGLLFGFLYGKDKELNIEDNGTEFTSRTAD